MASAQIRVQQQGVGPAFIQSANSNLDGDEFLFLMEIGLGR